ncbi:MAG TPA: AI-2E family transporter [Baekduia sp.]|nr:AI-2E family transporter [Baekduia sp.]
MPSPPTTSDGQPRGLRRFRSVGEACLWLLVVAVVVIGLLNLAWRLKLVVLPVLFALVFSTFLTPPARWLRRHGWPNALSAAASLVGALVLVGVLGLVVVPSTIEELDNLNVSLSGGLGQVEQWLADGPLTDEQAHTVVGHVQDVVNSNLDKIAAGAVSGAMVTLEILGGLALTLVLLFFFIKDGDRMWAWLVGLAPRGHRETVDEMGRRSWHALGGFVRGQTLTALFDAVFIGLALLVLGVPLVLPLAVITFFGAYVPIIGATVAGAAAALVALVTDGFATALGVVVAVLIVQQLEGNVFHPVVVGRAISVHPAAVLLGVTAGGVLGGVIGAMVAAPTVAMGAAILDVARTRSGEERADEVREAILAPAPDPERFRRPEPRPSA